MTGKPPVKRPTMLTKALKREVFFRIIDGETLQQICSDPHMPTARQVYLAVATDAEFQRTYKIARHLQVEEIVEEILGHGETAPPLRPSSGR